MYLVSLVTFRDHLSLISDDYLREVVFVVYQ